MTRFTTAATLGLALSVLAAPAASAGEAPGKDTGPVPSSSALPGAGAPPGGFADWAQLMREQTRLDAAADRLVAARGAGYAGIRVSPEDRRIELHWKGKPSAEVRAVLASLHRERVHVEVRPARHTERFLLAEAAKVARVPGVTGVAPEVDGSGLSVSGSSVKALRAARAASTTVATAEISLPTAASRGDDWAPYWGGARWNGCSTGFAVWVGGQTKMLSAGHCGANGGGAYDGGGQFMGTIGGDSDAYDTMYLNASSSGRVYDGGVGTGEFSKPVAGASRSYVGNWICTSGSRSGARCNIQVRSVNRTIWVTNGSGQGYHMYGLVHAEQAQRTNAAGNGDSGGPVFSLSADPNRVVAKGTISAIDRSTATTCTGEPASATRTCAWRMYYADVADSLARYGASIVTG
ncbi:hypothetical protein NUM3379_42030 [Kineococcus sp. NUM-3379]